MKQSQIDDTDLRLAIDELSAGRAMLAEAYALDKRERTEARKVAIAKIKLASRMIDEVVDRHDEPKLTRQGVRNLHAERT